MKNIAEEGLGQTGKSIESAGTKISEGLDHNRALESVGLNISQSLIISFSVLTFGVIASSYLNGVNKLQLLHASSKCGKELKQVDKSVSLNQSIEEENIMISYYWVRFVSATAAVGIATVGVLSIASRRLQ
mmetsp:Transcript_28618/g.39364  ORF Transcript_28618/g.39364 Transcript_28618/m.39364 type:complete len:131 (+) Transcript_28618:66-458(+)|eukprot:CAMPEP_0170079452 /NCGR_PEP_ID=MMETSP0019_2-20121128/15821_1 /TAXON_ID=98059 /ORGANISM="Dinobryon sp., Strain UTEXLB2267" /LENGTH=130 /DNA_ID=CAMNT_0010292899 /DNA_START=53 /DNA_END=445 /DNA_ORIENTATION=+